MRTAQTLVLLMLAFGVAACGRAGPPLKPSQAAAKQAKAEKRPAPEAPTPNSKNDGKGFILDGLLD